MKYKNLVLYLSNKDIKNRVIRQKPNIFELKSSSFSLLTKINMIN